MGMGIKLFSVKTGISPSKLRDLDYKGEFKPATVTKGGHRRYEESQVVNTRMYVRKMKILTGGNSVIGEECLDPFFAYLLGLNLADGTMLKTGQVQLELKDLDLLKKIASKLGVNVYKRKNKDMYRITVPRVIANQLAEYGMSMGKGKKGFEIPKMAKESFGIFLRGLFDGDGSISHRGNSTIVRFHGHPKPMADVQATLMKNFNVFLPWVRDNRCNSGMLEVSNREAVNSLRTILYCDKGIMLLRKKF